MFFEYALEPTAVNDWPSARYFLDAFGPWKGRFLAAYPKHWAKLLLDGLSCGDVEKKRISARLEQAQKGRVFYRRRDAAYDDKKPWIDNALQEHARRAFRAVIARGATAESQFLDASTLDESDPSWRVDGGTLLAREPAVFAKALELLLLASSQIVIIDPYFRADQPDKTRPLTAFCRTVSGLVNEVQVHCSDEHMSYALGVKHAERALGQCVPIGMKVSLHCWKERSGGPRLHNRYLLTDVGGVQFGDSIEQGATGHHDRVSILEEQTRARLWAEFAGSSPAFDTAGAVKRIDGKRPSS